MNIYELLFLEIITAASRTAAMINLDIRKENGVIIWSGQVGKDMSKEEAYDFCEDLAEALVDHILEVALSGDVEMQNGQEAAMQAVSGWIGDILSYGPSPELTQEMADNTSTIVSRMFGYVKPADPANTIPFDSPSGDESLEVPEEIDMPPLVVEN